MYHKVNTILRPLHWKPCSSPVRLTVTCFVCPAPVVIESRIQERVSGGTLVPLCNCPITELLYEVKQMLTINVSPSVFDTQSCACGVQTRLAACAAMREAKTTRWSKQGSMLFNQMYSLHSLLRIAMRTATATLNYYR